MDLLSQLGDRLTHFSAGTGGQWQILSVSSVKGESLALGERLALYHPANETPDNAAWTLRGVGSNTRYVTNNEKAALQAVQAGLGRPEATQAALIPIRKNAAWWALSQEERRDIF